MGQKPKGRVWVGSLDPGILTSQGQMMTTMMTVAMVVMYCSLENARQALSN